MKNKSISSVCVLSLLWLAFWSSELSAKILFSGGHIGPQNEQIATTIGPGQTIAYNFDLSSAAGIQSTGSFTTTVANQLVRVLTISSSSTNSLVVGTVGFRMLIDGIPCGYVDGANGGIDQCVRNIPAIGVHTFRYELSYKNFSGNSISAPTVTVGPSSFVIDG